MPIIVNICFHGIGTPRRELEEGEAKYWITTDRYREILDTIAGDERVRLSFDDGNVSDIEDGLPGLVERGLDATFFVLAGRLDQPGSLSSDDVRTLEAAGMRIGSHGMAHQPWRGLDATQTRRELIEARERIRAVTRGDVDEAALPLGRYDRRLLGELRRLDYRAVHTSDRRWARTSSWLQPRFSVHADDTADSVRRHVLATQPLAHRVERAVTCTVKRWR